MDLTVETREETEFCFGASISLDSVNCRCWKLPMAGRLTWDLSKTSCETSLCSTFGGRVCFSTWYCRRERKPSKTYCVMENPTISFFHGNNGRSRKRARRWKGLAVVAFEQRAFYTYLKNVHLDVPLKGMTVEAKWFELMERRSLSHSKDRFRDVAQLNSPSFKRHVVATG